MNEEGEYVGFHHTRIPIEKSNAAPELTPLAKALLKALGCDGYKPLLMFGGKKTEDGIAYTLAYSDNLPREIAVELLENLIAGATWQLAELKKEGTK